MKFSSALLSLTSVTAIAFLLSSCGSSGGSSSSGGTVKVKRKSGFNPHHGPFDSKGNYREEWADNPPKRVFTNGAPDEDEVRIAAVTPKPIEQPTIAAATPTVSKPATRKPTSNTYYAPTPTAKKPTTKKPTVKKPTTTVKKPTKPVYVKPKPVTKPPIIHVVKSGDTLWSLAQKYKSGVKTIQIANGLQGNVIKIGQTLKIPRF